MSTHDFSSSYTTPPHNLLIEVFSEIIHFVFKSKVCCKIVFLTTFIYWTFKDTSRKKFLLWQIRS